MAELIFSGKEQHCLGMPALIASNKPQLVMAKRSQACTVTFLV